MKLKGLFGILLGFTIGILIYGLWKGEISWELLIFMCVGGVIGHFAIALLKKEDEENKRS